MEFRIADVFTDSLAKLTGEEQKRAKTTAKNELLEVGARVGPGILLVAFSTPKSLSQSSSGSFRQ